MIFLKFFLYLTGSNGNSKSIWKAINELTNKNASANSSRTKDISANELNSHFSTTADNVSRTESNDLCVLKEFCDIKHRLSAPPVPPMTITKLYNALVHLKQTGTRGLDGKILKLSATVISDTLTYVYNLCIQNCYVPAAFKQAKVIPLFKSGKSSDPSNCRPVSVLSALSKPFEKHINKHILAHFNKNNLLHSNQSGFRENHPRHTALASLVDQWLSRINGNKFCGAFFCVCGLCYSLW